MCTLSYNEILKHNERTNNKIIPSLETFIDSNYELRQFSIRYCNSIL